MSKILKPHEASEYLGIPVHTLSDWRYKDRGRLNMGQRPQGPVWIDNPTRVRCRGYQQADLDAWIDQQRVTS